MASNVHTGLMNITLSWSAHTGATVCKSPQEKVSYEFAPASSTVRQCSILPLHINKQGTRIYNNIILYLYSSAVTRVWSRRTVGESLHTQRSYQESEQPAVTDFSQNFRPYIVLKLPHDPPGHSSSPTLCLFFICHGLLPHSACSPSVTTYTNALLVFR